MLAYNGANSFHNPLSAIGSDPSVVWQTTLDVNEGDLFFGGDRLYIDSEDRLSAVDVGTGRAISGEVPMRVLTYWDDVLYYSSLEGADERGTTAVQADELFPVSSKATPKDENTLLWEDNRILRQGKRVGSTFYGLTDNDEIVALDALEGEEKWSSGTPIQPNSFIVTDSHVILYNYEQISALDTESGEEQWRKEPDAEQVLDSVELEQSIKDLIDDPSDVSLKFSSVRVSNGTLLVSEIDSMNALQVVSARDLATGDAIWFRQNAWLTGVTEDQFFSQAGMWDVSTGDSRWQVGPELPFEATSPLRVIATQNHILVAGGQPDNREQGRLIAFHQSDGSQSWSIDFDARIWRCIAVNDTIYATTTDGSLFGISASSKEIEIDVTTANQETTEQGCGEPELSPDSSKVGETVAFTGEVTWKGEAAMEVYIWDVQMSDPSSQKFQEVSEGDCVTVEGVWAQNSQSGDFYIEDASITN